MNQPPRKNDKLLELLGHAEWLKALARSLVTNETEADDLVQQTWLAASERPPKDTLKPRAWLSQVARRLSWRHNQKQANQQEHLGSHEHGSSEYGDRSVERLEMHREISEAVMSLPDFQRQCVVMRYFDGMSRSAIANQLGVPEETVKTRLRRGIEKLRSEMQARHGSQGKWQNALIVGMSLRELSPTAVITTSSTTASLIGGGILMSLSTKLFLTMAVLVAAVVTWSQFEDEEEKLHAEAQIVVADAQRANNPSRHKAKIPAKVSSMVSMDGSDSESSKPPTKPASKNAKTTRISGIVVNEHGLPVVGAAIYWSTGSSGLAIGGKVAFSRQIGTMHSQSEPAQRKQRAVVDTVYNKVKSRDGGNFDIEVPSQDTNVDLGAYDEKYGYDLIVGVAIDDLQKSNSLRLTLTPGVVFQGYVRDKSGIPLADAVVSISGGKTTSKPDGSVTSTLSDVGSVRTNEEGHYRSWLLPFRFFRLTCDHPKFRRESKHTVAKPDVRLIEMDFEHEPSEWHSGLILDQEGNHFDLFVAIDAVRKDRSRLEYLSEFPIVLTSKRKLTYHSTPSPQIELKLNVKESKYERNPIDGASSVILYAGDQAIGSGVITPDQPAPDILVDTTKLPHPDLRTTVTFHARDLSGNPIPAYDVEWVVFERAVSRKQSSATHEARGSDGRILIRDVPCRPSKFEIVANGYASQSQLIEPNVGENAVEITLKPTAGSIRGTAHGIDGKPITGAYIFALPKSQTGWATPSGDLFRKTNSQGIFRITGLAAGEYLIVSDAEDMTLVPKIVVVHKGEAKCSLIEVPTVRVRFIPSVINHPMQFKIRNLAGQVFRDDILRGRSMTGGGPSALLPPGRYTIEVTCAAFEPCIRQFKAQEGATVKLEMIRRN